MNYTHLFLSGFLKLLPENIVDIIRSLKDVIEIYMCSEREIKYGNTEQKYVFIKLRNDYNVNKLIEECDNYGINILVYNRDSNIIIKIEFPKPELIKKLIENDIYNIYHNVDEINKFTVFPDKVKDRVLKTNKGLKEFHKEVTEIFDVKISSIRLINSETYTIVPVAIRECWDGKSYKTVKQLIYESKNMDNNISFTNTTKRIHYTTTTV